MPAKVKDELQKKYLYDSVSVPSHVLFKDLVTVGATALWDHFEENFLEI